MKKFIKNTIVAVLATVTAVGAGAALLACGDGNAAKAARVTAVYISDPGSVGSATFKSVPMKMVFKINETVTVYDDNTYCFNVTSTVITGIEEAFNSTGNLIDRGSTELEFYGTFTSETDSGITTLTLAKPTRVTILNTNTLLTGGVPVGFYDTAAWNDEITEAHATWWGNFVSQDTQPTAENVLDKLAFENDTEVVVSENGTFEIVRCDYQHSVLAAMGF